MKILNNVKRNKVLSFFLFCLFAFCLVANNVGVTDALAKTVQIENEGGSTSGTGINVSKVVSATDIENVFDITLNIETETEVSKMYENPPMSVVVVMDISNSMFTKNSSTGIVPYDDALKAMKDFINQYSNDAKESIVPRELAVVTFNTNAYVQQSLVDCSGSVTANTIYNNVSNGINNVIDVGVYGDHDSRFTNMEAGLRMAENILDTANTENKFIILISDGLPTTYSKKSTNSSMSYIEGYPPFSSSGERGTNGVFYSELDGCYCDCGTSYSDTAAIKAYNRAKKIKDKDISIYCMGVNIGGQLVEDFQQFVVESNTGYSSDQKIYDALAINNSAAKGTYDHPYKDWLYNEIGNQYYKDGNTYDEMLAVYNEIYKTIKDNGKKIVINSWKASDPMNQSGETKNIEFLKFYKKSGKMTTSKKLEGAPELNAENSAHFSTSSEKITWDVPSSGYTTKVVGGKTIYCYSLKYRVRLKNETEGFLSNTAVPTNGKTILKYLTNNEGTMTENSIEFKVPEVKGYLGEFSFIKVDADNKQPLSGVEFKLSHKADSCSVCEAMGSVVTIADMTAVSDANGKVKFSSIPSGHEYILVETSTINGYIIDNTEYDVSVEIGEVKINGNTVFETLGNMPKSFKLTYVVVTPEDYCPADDKTDETPDVVTGILYGRDVTIESALTTEAQTDREGRPGEWVFSGWYEDASCTGSTINEINITEDETVYGKWEFIPNKYKVEYVLSGDPLYGIPTDNDANIAPTDNNEYIYGDTAVVKPQKSTVWTTVDGNTNTMSGTWHFTGWYDNNKYTGTPLTEKVIHQDEIFYGKWEFVPDTYTLDYVVVTPYEECPNADTSAVTSLLPDSVNDIEWNTDITLENGLTTDSISKNGLTGVWVFSGWYEDAACSGETLDVINIKRNETVYGKWEFIPGKVNLKYEVEGDPIHGLPTDSVTPVDDSIYDINDLAQVKDTLETTENSDVNGISGEWTFDGWYYDDEYINAVDTDSVIMDEHKILYGKWSFVPYTYTLDYVIVDTGAGIPQAELTDKTPATVYNIPYDINKKLAKVLDTRDKAKDGIAGVWVFKGWFKNSDCSGNVIKYINIKQDETVYGTWEFVPNKIDVEYIVEGDPIYGLPFDSYVPKDTNVYNVGDTVVVKDVLTTNDVEDSEGTPGKWTFDGWYFDDEYTQPVDDEVVITEHEIFYGRWKFVPDTYTLDYVIVDTGYGAPDASLTDATPEIVTGIPYNTDKKLAEEISTRDDKNGVWVFKGWYEYSDCKGSTIKEINIRKNETVYGTWEFVPKKYKVEYEITGDIIYGVPTDVVVPSVEIFDYKDLVEIKENLITGWITSDGTPDGIPGRWEFVIWDRDDFIITEDTTIYGKWVFTPEVYTLKYVIVSDENPSDMVIPSMVTDIPYNTDKTLANKLVTALDEKDGVEGVWTFKGWYENENCTGTAIDVKNIKQDEIVYGLWEFVPNGMVNVGDKTPVAAAILLIMISLTGMGFAIRKK